MVNDNSLNNIELSEEELGQVTGGIKTTVGSADKKWCPLCKKEVSYTSFAGGRDLCNICRTQVQTMV